MHAPFLQLFSEIADGLEGGAEVGHLTLGEEHYLVEHVEDLNAWLVNSQQNTAARLGQPVQHRQNVLGCGCIQTCADNSACVTNGGGHGVVTMTTCTF